MPTRVDLDREYRPDPERVVRISYPQRADAGLWPSGVGNNDVFDNGGFMTARDFIERQIAAPTTATTPAPAP